ncbi:diguanylate cyclase domain-containing protein [Haliea sp.]
MHAAMAGEVFRLTESQLLPGNLVDLLSRAKATGKFVTQDYSLADRYLHIGLHWLERSQEYHLFLEDITERKLALQKLEYLAFHDELTWLPNRAVFYRDLHEQTATAAGLVQIALLKINHFQEVINRGAHSLGDVPMCLLAAVPWR